MKTNWVISDPHFGHENIIAYCNRPFKDVFEMDTTIISNWNNTVDDDDNVYMLGDWAHGKGSLEKLAAYLPTLNGNIIMIRGNHDRQNASWYKQHGVKKIHGGEYWIYSKENHVVLSHRPTPLKTPWLNIHGHIHNDLMQIGPSRIYINVSVEVINYTPINLDLLISSVRYN